MFDSKDFVPAGDGLQDVTDSLQSLLNQAAAAGTSAKRAQVVLRQGTYLTRSLYVGSHTELVCEEGAVLLAVPDVTAYPVKAGRVAGIDMLWPQAVLNLDGVQDVLLSGPLTVNGQGPYWWERYWGKDQKGGLRKDYDARGLRWCVDYDCPRLRNVLIKDCTGVQIQGLQSTRSGFWNVHCLKTRHLLLDGLNVYGNEGPSTDGIDLDSCMDAEVCHCKVSCDDDNLCLKAGRGADRQESFGVCSQIYIHDCEIGKGCGVTVGSEISGGIQQVRMERLHFKDTQVGIRIKGTPGRGGFIRDIQVKDVLFDGVKYGIHFNLNWHPAYSHGALPPEFAGKPLPEHWQKILTADQPGAFPEVSDFRVSGVRCSGRPLQRAFDISGLQEKPIERLTLTDSAISCCEFGRISGVKDMKMDARISAGTALQPELDVFDVR